jgi:hypothetical protein
MAIILFAAIILTLLRIWATYTITIITSSQNAATFGKITLFLAAGSFQAIITPISTLTISKSTSSLGTYHKVSFFLQHVPSTQQLEPFGHLQFSHLHLVLVQKNLFPSILQQSLHLHSSVYLQLNPFSIVFSIMLVRFLI